MPFAYSYFRLNEYAIHASSRAMTSTSKDSPVDHERFSARTDFVFQEGSSQPQAHQRAETDFAAVGGQFGDRRLSYPQQLELSGGEEPTRQPYSASHAGAYLSASPVEGSRPLFGSPSTTPTPNRDHYAPYAQHSDLPLVKRGRKRRRQDFDHYTQNSGDASSELSDTTEEDPNEDNEDDERGRSTTPRPYYPLSYTPSQVSVETGGAEHNEGRAPVSPDPFSAYAGHDPERTKGEVDNFEAQFAATKRPRAG